jgi:hypothetical protein
VLLEVSVTVGERVSVEVEISPNASITIVPPMQTIKRMVNPSQPKIMILPRRDLSIFD